MYAAPDLQLITYLLQTNFWGATNISLAAIKFFREVNKPAGGRLIQASSIYGICVSSIMVFSQNALMAFLV
jgi:hypothetical protein